MILYIKLYKIRRKRRKTSKKAFCVFSKISGFQCPILYKYKTSIFYNFLELREKCYIGSLTNARNCFSRIQRELNCFLESFDIVSEKFYFFF